MRTFSCKYKLTCVFCCHSIFCWWERGNNSSPAGNKGFRWEKSRWWWLSFTLRYLAVSPALLPDSLDPGHHVLLVLRLQQVLAEVLCGEPQGVLPFGVPVGDVHQTSWEADGWAVLQPAAWPGCLQHSLSLVFVEEEWVGTKHREDTLPRSQATSCFLPRGWADSPCEKYSVKWEKKWEEKRASRFCRFDQQTEKNT